MLEEVLFRCKQIPGVDVVALAIPDTAENDIIEKVAPHNLRHVEWGIPIVRGPEHDVLARYAHAAEAVNADVIMRITADCPLIDPEVCGEVLTVYRQRDAAYCSNCHPRTWPHGFDCEVFSASLLRRANEAVVQVHCPPREHVTPHIRLLADGNSHNVEHQGENRSHLRWTLDTLEDYVRIWRVFEEQMGVMSDKPPYRTPFGETKA